MADLAPTDRIAVRQRVFNTFSMRLRKAISDESMLASEPEMTLQYDTVARMFIATLRADLVKGWDETEYMHVPATPWQMWKEWYMPDWFTKRWPVMYRAIRYVKTIRVCPHLPIHNNQSAVLHADFLEGSVGL